MDIMEAIRTRHSVRRYTDTPLTQQHIEILNDEINRCNKEGDLHFQLILNEPKAFGNFFASYGLIKGAKNYIALIGKNTPDLSEKCGWYGEHLVLKAQQSGLNTCWVGGSYKKVKSAFTIREGEKLCLVIAIGYGKNQGSKRPSKSFNAVTETTGEFPQWFKNGVEAALLAPTAINQQRFKFILEDNRVTVKDLKGPYSKVDLGIVKYHFEAGAGKENFEWSE
ncbi:MAG: nitroreductase [Ruminococcaceae bacterium]|nr:nitroreductase [Oscillospiraceae bacterium]